MLNLNANQRYAIIGSSGSGKSNLAYLLFENLRKRRQPLAIIDHKGEYTDLPGITVVKPRDISGADLAVRLRNSNASVSIDMRRLKEKEKTEWAADFIETCLRLPRKIPILIAIEEAHNYCPQAKTSDSKLAIMRLASEGRSNGYGLVLISQRCSKLHKDSLAESEFIYFLRHNWGKDQQYIADLIGQDRAAEIGQLRTGQIIVMDYPGNKFYEPEQVKKAKRKKRGGTPKAVGVDPDINALTAEYPRPYSQTAPETPIQAPLEVIPEQSEGTGWAAGVMIAVVIGIIALTVFIWFYAKREADQQLIEESQAVQNV